MTISINGKTMEIDTSITIIELLHKLNITQLSGVAIAQNQSLVRKSEWEHTTIHNGDEIEILQATAGG